MTRVPGPDPLVIRSLEFLGGMAGAEGWRPEPTLPEIAFAGRSNVGKSSLLNTLVRRKAFARVSRTPGRTREINFFNVNNQFILADLPGYGYARISKERKADWKPLIEGYLKKTTVLAGVVLLLDIRRDPSEDDMAMLDFLADVELPTIVVLTKTDKLTRAGATERVEAIRKNLSLEPDQTIPFSSSTGEGRDELAEALAGLLDAVRGEPT
ncbi:MAG TPA: ribosome biogenesis GTP-binding protein YihA/YsxC [Gemmatimonadaceae bacterium]|nr:ribosome biogenesis GTP-binding protein YihA/YsxC [Gemmatimonadaceae bacterium]